MSGFTAGISQHLFDTTVQGAGRLKGVIDQYGNEDYIPTFVQDNTQNANVVAVRNVKGEAIPFPGATAAVNDISVANGGAATNAPTINLASGRFTALAGATSLVISNNQVTALTKVFVNLASADTTGWIKNAVCGAGTITIALGAALNANANIDFHITA